MKKLGTNISPQRNPEQVLKKKREVYLSIEGRKTTFKSIE